MALNQNRRISYLLCALQKAKTGTDLYNQLHDVWMEWVTYREELGGDEKALLNSLTPYLESHSLSASDVSDLIGKATYQAKAELAKVRRKLDLSAGSGLSSD